MSFSTGSSAHGLFSTYGLTLEPATGALVGAVCLGQAIGARMSIAVACVTIAALGVTLPDRYDDGN